jgi:hypothetical protein
MVFAHLKFLWPFRLIHQRKFRQFFPPANPPNPPLAKGGERGDLISEGHSQ